MKILIKPEGNVHLESLKIPESQGDSVDQSQEQIDYDMQEKLYQIRKKVNQFKTEKEINNSKDNVEIEK